MKNRFLVPAVLVIAVLCFIGAYTITNFGKAGSTVNVYKDGELIHTLFLSEKPQTVNLGTNVILIEKDGVSMIDATCPDKLCINQGKIKNSSRSIVCLPNRIVVEFADVKGEVDTVAGR